MFGRFFSVLIALILLNGCAVAADDKVRQELVRTDSQKLPISYALQGTKTAVVGIAIDKKGYPLETVRAIVLTPGQKVIFAGPDDFQIAFKNKKAPSAQLEYRSEKGVISVEIPKDILERPEYRKEYAKKRSVEFNYAIRINGRELDPPIIVKREE
jgi:hypothetical protein